MKRFTTLILVIIFLLTEVSWGQTNPGFETGDLTGWTDTDTGTETISTTNVRTGTFLLSYATNNSSNQKIDNNLAISVANNSYLHILAWVIGSNVDANASIAIKTTTWTGGTSTNTVIGTSLQRLTHRRQNTSGSSLDFTFGLNSKKTTNATVLYWDDVVAYVSTSSTTDLTAPNSATNVNSNSNADGTSITITWTDGTDAATGSQEAIILRASGLNQTPPTLNDQGRYSVAGGSSGPNTVGSWTVVGVVNVGTQTFNDNSTAANTQYTYAVYMHDLAYNYSAGTSSSITALPVVLTSFTALHTEKGVKLNWETATEVNNYGFEILRFAQNDMWEKIGFVNGHGNSNSPKSYSFTDEYVPTGKVQYRLKQIDFDGKFEYSNVAEVNIEVPGKLVLYQNMPNPFNPVTEIKFALPKSSKIELSIYNMLGEKVQTLASEIMNAGEHKVSFNAANLSSGVYFYKLTTESNSSIKKMILMK